MNKISLSVQEVIHFNNFIFLIFSYCTIQITDEQICDQSSKNFLSFVFYGNLIIYAILFLFLFLWKSKILDRISQNCGAVLVTINTFIIIFVIIIYDIVTMIMAIKVYFFEEPSICKELQLFTMVCAYIFFVWLLCLLIGLINKIVIRKFAQQPTNYYKY